MAWLRRLKGGWSQNRDRVLEGAGSSFRRHRSGTAGLVGLMALALAGCGNQYRPVVTPINPTGPAALPTANVVLISQPGFSPLLPGTTGPCAGVVYGTPSVFSLVNFSGDSLMNQANGGNGPLTFSLDTSGTSVYAPNCDGTLTNATATTGALVTKSIQTSTLVPTSWNWLPTNTLLANGNLYLTEVCPGGLTCVCPNGGTTCNNFVAQLTGSPEALKQEIPVAPSLINLTGYSTGERIYAISQGNSGGGTQPAWGDCANPSTVTVNGEADAIETTTNTISATLPLGICPVYGFMTPDLQRTFIVNRGSGTVTVINSQLNAIDAAHPSITVGAGPVYADYYRLGQVLVTANYDSNTISIIDVSLDQYGNDSTTFGTVLATVPVGLHPVEVTVLQDGSRVYVANQGDLTTTPATPGSVSIVNLSDYTVEKTIALTANPHAIASVYNYPIGKVYVASQNSPYLTVIRTDTDVVSATPEMQGNIVEMRVSAQYPGQSSTGNSNYRTESRSVGSGAP
ncbi:MAG: YncE family protein [Acidobacteriaceae bacterium]